MTLSTDSRSTLKLDKNRPIHFVGVGGIGMSGLARLLVDSGFTVSGSDLGENPNTFYLASKGARIFRGHDAANVPEDAIVVATTAVSEENPEIRRARECNMPVFHRSDLLCEILHGEAMGHETTIGVSGSHGKTSVTGMAGVVLTAGGVAPTIIAGGRIPEFESNAVLGKDRKVAVAELDESDGTLLRYTPTHSVILNLELDHPDHYGGGMAQLEDTFRQYLRQLPAGSKVLFNVSCPNTKAILDEFLGEGGHPGFEPVLLAPGDIFSGHEPYLTYNLKNARDYDRGCYLGYVYRKDRMLGELIMAVPGRHQLFNGLVAIAFGDMLDLPFEPMAEALQNFQGMGRRFEIVGTCQGATLVDDYAHHPTEVQATVKAAVEYQEGMGHLTAIFQPHRYTRLKALWNEFVNAFEGTDVLYLTDVYAAGEQPIEGVDGRAFYEAVVASGKYPEVRYFPDTDWGKLRDKLRSGLSPGDVVLSMGAGNITQLLRGWPA